MLHRFSALHAPAVAAAALLLVTASPLRAQSDFGGWAGPTPALTWFNGEPAFVPGISVGYVLFRHWFVGGDGHALLDNVRSDSLSAGGRPLFLSIGLVSGRVGYTHSPERFLSPVGSLGFGVGSVEYGESFGYDPDRPSRPHYLFWYVEPEAGVDLAFAAPFHLELSLGWRIAAVKEEMLGAAGGLGAPIVRLRGKIGWFGERE